MQLELRARDGSSRPYDLRPSKIIGIGVNYRAHAAEMRKEVPSEPLFFLKPPSSLLAPGDAIVRPAGYKRVDHEAELGVVIGRRAKNVRRERALDYVLGFTCVNDVTVRDLQQPGSQWAHAKGFDTFCPVGPRICSGLDPGNLLVKAFVNGAPRQSSYTSDMVFSVPVLVEFLSTVMTLEAGDIIATGTPSGVGPLVVGDRVAIEIEPIGRLENTVVGALAGEAEATL